MTNHQFVFLIILLLVMHFGLTLDFLQLKEKVENKRHTAAARVTVGLIEIALIIGLTSLISAAIIWIAP